MKKSYWIIAAIVAVIGIAGVVYATSCGSCTKEDGKACCKKDKTSQTTNANCCDSDGPCTCEGCSGECKAKCDAAGHCVCTPGSECCDSKTAQGAATSQTVASNTSVSTCDASCDQNGPCSCKDCSGECKAACDAAGQCVCGN